MTILRNLTFGALTLLTLASAVGCGQMAGTAPVAGLSSASSRTPEVTVQGTKRKLGYDWNRYQKKLAKKAKPRKLPRQGLLPTKVDLRQHDAPVYDQGQLGACTAFAMGKGLREHMARRDGERVAPLSALFLYYETRKALGSINEDSGGTITDGMAVLERTGVALDEGWAYDIAKFKIKPPTESYKEAAEYKIPGAVQLGSLEDVRTALAKGNPVPFGYMVYKSFTKIGADGVMPMPKAGEEVMGGHAVLAVGYDDQKRQLIIRNSWSAKWADKGYFYMPYEFVNGDNTGDFWMATK